MNTNRFESPKANAPKRRVNTSVGPAWWGLAVGAAFFFVAAIWLLTHAA
jgi:hypothetical protein